MTLRGTFLFTTFVTLILQASLCGEYFFHFNLLNIQFLLVIALSGVAASCISLFLYRFMYTGQKGTWSMPYLIFSILQFAALLNSGWFLLHISQQLLLS